ncbi:MAG: undecaprenyl/decaprenyl-phosphate alpha-N-acetylglucosaminyl 1-phosphate transferase [Clostridia bacterium]|nr:undecaprenyl/decaprenyl-phosphate alpha-N-acetylglucosaminyl 1-phosphate transferase [Clostridia bacterium]
MIDNSLTLTSLFAFILALAVAFAATPAVKMLAIRIKAVDVPRDSRRMHKTPIPRLGGLAIFLGFLVSILIFGRTGPQMAAILVGAILLVALGMVDDVVALKPGIKFLGQIVAALIPTLAGVVITRFTNPFSAGGYFNLGIFSIPVTILWIVGITNAVNFIDGLDGLACGVSAIATVTMFVIAVLYSEYQIALMMAALAGACLGFLPYNMNPAKIFMGDTGSMFLGYILAVTSIQGLFKFYAVISFAVPFILLGLPIFDTAFAIIRRLAHGQSPLQADRGHVHHRLIDLGFDQKQSVAILYAFSAVLGLTAVLLATTNEAKLVILALAVLICFFLGMSLMTMEKRHQKEEQARLDELCHELEEKDAREAAVDAAKDAFSVETGETGKREDKQ